jgi:hypothetical protein
MLISLSKFCSAAFSSNYNNIKRKKEEGKVEEWRRLRRRLDI